MNQPDILFVVLDTQRADRLGSYGYDRPLTPNLDKFAAQGVLFQQAVAPAQWTVPSHASMFSGLYPTAHQVLQSAQRLSPSVPHIAELLSDAGYDTVGFCNNPLVGILDNGLKRGFHHFYNYGGAVPSRPRSSSIWPRPLNRAAEAYTQLLRRFSYPVQNFFGKSDLAFQVSLNSWLTPFWSRLANFKGQNERSVGDVITYLHGREQEEQDKPLFLFLNLMETHLPFWPPGPYIDQTAPYFRMSKEARDIMRTWNREAYRWAAPLAEPLGDLESQVLSDMYDAEVAYQDDYLGGLLQALQRRKRQRDTLTIFVADHGDGLGEHGYMGHAFVGYEELVHVPLMMQWPAVWPQAARIDTPVSTRRLFHTLLDAGGVWPESMSTEMIGEAKRLTLRSTINDRDPEQGTAFSEIYPPLNFVKAIEQRQPQLLETFRCLAERRAVVQQTDGSVYKLVNVDGQADELFDLPADPLELESVLTQRPAVTAALESELARMVTAVEQQRNRQTAEKPIELEHDAQLQQRLRGLGYLE
jgi:uncharacterized sulfatase